MTKTLERCPVCSCKGTYEQHEDGWAPCSNCGMEENSKAADALEEIRTQRFEGQPDENERTCHNVSDAGFGFKCSECGDWEDIEYNIYCPHCGAKVVND